MYYEMKVDEALQEAEELGEIDYQPSCDLSFGFGGFTQEVSCSKILQSEYAKGFGLLHKVNTNILKPTMIQYSSVYGWDIILT